MAWTGAVGAADAPLGVGERALRGRRLGFKQWAFLGLLLLAFPVAAFHYVSGRPAQAAMAAGAAVFGLLLFREWLRSDRAQTVPAPEVVQTVFVPPLEAAPAAAERVPPAPAPGRRWLPRGAAAGLVAAAAGAIVVEVELLAAAAFGDPAHGTLRRWLWMVAPTGAAGALRALAPLAIVLLVGLTLAAGLAHARLAAAWPGANGGPHAVALAVVLWLFAMLAALPIAGDGTFGVLAGAGPLPALGLLTASGAAATALVAFDTPAQGVAQVGGRGWRAALRDDRGAIGGALVGSACGLGAGLLAQGVVSVGVMLPDWSFPLGGTLVGWSWGTLLGSLPWPTRPSRAPASPGVPRADQLPATTPPGDDGERGPRG